MKKGKIFFYFFLILIISLFLSKQSSALPTHINPFNWVEKAPSKANVNFYDELFLDVVPRYFHNISPHGYNYGTKIEADVLIWEGKDFCAFVFYDRIFDPDWAYAYSWILGAKLKNVFEQSNNSVHYSFYNEKCALYDTSADYSGKKKRAYNENIGRVDKRKGIKGNLKPVRVQRFEYLNPKLECLFLGGGLGTSGWSQYSADLTTASISAHLCVKDGSYFTKDKIKQLARSLGVKDIPDASLKIKAEAPEDLLLDLSAFTEVTGKRDDYSITLASEKSEKKETIDSNNSQDDTDTVSTDLNNDSIEEKLIKLKNLFDKDLITEEEYKEQKKELLDLL